MTQYSGQVWKLGDRSSAVAMIQSRLQELGYYPSKSKRTGYFGEVTKSAVVAFQRETFPIPKGFTHVKSRMWKARYWDGIVGPMTWKALWPKPNSTPTKTETFISNMSSKVYKRPPAGWVLTQEEKKERYGNVPSEVEDNLVEINFLNKKIMVHSLHAEQFKAVNDRIRAYEEKHKLKAYIPQQIATYNWRVIRGGNTLSNHSFGIAVDIDWKYNPMTSQLKGIESWSKSKDKMPSYVIESFQKEGARWGGKFKTRKDYMHFEF